MNQQVTRLLIFDPHHGGHHAEYVLHLVRNLTARAPGVELHLSLSASLVEESDALSSCSQPGMWPEVALEILPHLNASGTRQSMRLQAAQFRGLIERHRPTHAVALYADHLQPALATGLRFPFPVIISGILFRPTFHVSTFGERPGSMRERAKKLGKSLMLRAALRNPHVSSLMCLDPVAVEVAESNWKTRKLIWLPDPVEPGPMQTEATRSHNGPKRILVFGVLDDRKGIEPLMTALTSLQPSMRSGIQLILAGSVPADCTSLLKAIDDVRKTGMIHIDFENVRVPESEVQSTIQRADLISLLYQDDHVGSSGVLIRAAAAGVPVLATNRGLVGHQTREHRLGITVPSSDTAAIHDALRNWLRGADIGFDAGRAAAFAAANSPSAFARTFYDTVLRTSNGRDVDHIAA